MILKRIGWMAATLLLLAPSIGPAAELPEWTRRIRRDHPRLFFNADTWPEVRGRVLGAEKAWYTSTKQSVDRLLAELGSQTQVAPRELGPAAAQAAFVFLMTDDKKYLALAERCLDASLRFYDQCYRDGKTVNWYSTSRVHAICAWDWLYNHLDESKRADLLARLVQAIDNVLRARPTIYRENMSGYETGFYGVRNCLWFLGCTGFGTGIETERINRWLVWGHDENLRMLEHRKRACGDDGGGASPTLGYVFGAYPWAEQNFFYTWLSSTGEDIAPRWPHSAWLTNYAQTVAHNCVVIHQPGEPPARYWGGTVEGNHGGQHKQIGSVLKAFHTGDEFVYVAGDATACYRHGVVRRKGQPDLGKKCALATRQLVFLPPDRFVIFDRVAATKPEYRKEWLIHTAHEPTIREKTIRADHRGGRMFCRTLLPADAVLTPVGGRGKESFAAGKNWPILDRGLSEENRAMMGTWRVEVAPGSARQEDVFLHVLQVGDRRLEAMSPVELVDGDGVCGVRLACNDRTWTATFRTRGEIGGRLRGTGGKEKELNCELTNTVQPQQGAAERAKSP